MPPKVKITKEDIINKGIELVREHGADSINARGIANALGCSTQPIFSNFESMEDLSEQIILSAYDLYLKFIETELGENKYPPYKAYGMAYIRFAKKEKELFKLLFMSKEGAKTNGSDFVSYDDIISAMANALGIGNDTANQMHTEMWIWVHGAATCIASDFLMFDEEKISEMLTVVYNSLRDHYTKKQN